jgi:hypothetical protein
MGIFDTLLDGVAIAAGGNAYYNRLVSQSQLVQGGTAIAQAAVNASAAAATNPGGAPLQIDPTGGIAAPDIGTNPPDAPQNLQDTAGRRVRLRAKPAAINDVYGSGIMAPLLRTNGMIFPYQPLITYSQDVMYSTTEMVHTNQDFQSYSRTPALRLGVEGEFTVQNQTEGLYALACIHLLRTASKMWFGGQSSQAINRQGTPPPVLLFDAYGQYMFNALPVIITQFNVTLPKDVDYFPVNYIPNNSDTPVPNQDYNFFANINQQYIKQGTTEGYAWIPSQFSIGVQLTVQNTPQRLRTFDLGSFRDGDLLRRGGWV